MLQRLLRALNASGYRALNERGIRLWERGDLRAAEGVLRRAILRAPESPEAHSNLGMVLLALHQYEDAMQHLERAVRLAPDHPQVLNNLGVAYAQGNNPASAAEHLSRAIAIDPDHAEARANLLRPLMETCDWARLEREIASLREAAAAWPVDRWAPRLHPYTALLLPLPPEIPRDVARHHANALFAASGRRAAPPWRPRDRIRIGYLSADLQNHATAHLCAGMFALHDRSRFEVHAYSWGRDDGSDWRRRIREGCDRFVDITNETPEATVRRIAGDGIDILVDMKGYCGDSRPAILASRAAPLQVAFLGYPGSMQASFIDYVVADRTVLPEALSPWFSEAPVWMPGSYQVNDPEQPIDPRSATRQECALPEDAFVFCSFNQTYKIDRDTWACWMRILAAVPRSVLWLLRSNVPAKYALWKAADAAGIDRSRIVFAPRLEKPQHLARIGAADLVLDHFVVNAHTTASDALFAGVPVLTAPGDTFAARVAASLLQAAGLPELVARDRVDYEARAKELALRPGELGALRARLAGIRETTLFDTRRYVRDLESAFHAMAERASRGLPPARIVAG